VSIAIRRKTETLTLNIYIIFVFPIFRYKYWNFFLKQTRGIFILSFPPENRELKFTQTLRKKRNLHVDETWKH